VWLSAGLALGVLAAQSLVLAQDGVPAGQRVFYASHSLMWDMPPVLQQQAEAYGIEGHSVLGIQRLGVSRTLQHWNLPDEQNQAKQALETGDVDVFVMSPIALPDEGIDNFVRLGLEHNPDMRFLIQVSWPGLGLTDNNDFNTGAFGGGFGGGPPTGGAAPPAAGARGAAPGGAAGGRLGGGRGGAGAGGQDYNRSPDELAIINVKNDRSAEEQAAKLNEEAGRQVVFLVPTSQAHNALRLAIYNGEMPGMTDQGEVFADFIGHPTPPVIALNTYVHFAVLYNRSPIGLPVPGVLQDAGGTEEMNLKLQEIAWEIVSNYPPSGVAAASR
jgi:hypothetical protein